MIVYKTNDGFIPCCNGDMSGSFYLSFCRGRSCNNCDLSNSPLEKESMSSYLIKSGIFIILGGEIEI